MAALSDEAFLQALDGEIKDIVPAEQAQAFATMIKPNVEFMHETQHWASVFFEALELTKHPVIIQEAGASFYEAALSYIEANTLDFKALSTELKDKLGVKGKGLFMPLRVALTDEIHGPEMAAIFSLLGKEKVIARLQQAADLCG